MKERFAWLAASNLVLLTLGTPAALMAGQSSLITASGTMPEVITVELPPVQSSNPLELASDGTSLMVANSEPVKISANVPGLMELSRVQLTPPSGVDLSRVGAAISLRANGKVLIRATTSSSGSNLLGIGVIEAMVNADFYSSTNQPLPAGTYTATTVISVMAE